MKDDDTQKTISFSTQPNKNILTLHADGRVEKGEGLSNDEATQVMFTAIAANFPKFVAGIADVHQRELVNRCMLLESALQICRNALFIEDEDKHAYAIEEADKLLPRGGPFNTR